MFYFFAGVLFFQGVYVFTQWRKYRKPEYLYYCFYLLFVVLYFFFIFERDLFFTSELADSVLRLIKEPTVLITFYFYLLFGEHFIEIHRYPAIHKVIKIMKTITLLHIAGTIITGFADSIVFRFWYFASGNIILLIFSLYVILQLMRMTQPLAIFILRGSLCAIAGTLLTNIFNALPLISGPEAEMNHYLVMLPAVVGILLESYYFLTGLNYKSFKTEEEISGKLISQLNENERLLIEKQMIRNKIAQDLHDDIGASLSSIHIYSSVAEKEMIENPEKARAFLQQINQSTRQVMENMSDIVWAMETEHTEERSFSSRIKDFGYGLLTQKNIDCSYIIDRQAEMKIVDLEARKNILLMVKEALNNIAKYSEATRAEVQIVSLDGSIAITITDNGRGFDTNSMKNGHGLRNMKQRAALLGGDCRFSSSPGRGTTIQVQIPIANISGRFLDK